MKSSPFQWKTLWATLILITITVPFEVALSRNLYRIIGEGAWAESGYIDPFLSGRPVQTYLAPGTVIYERKKSIHSGGKLIQVKTHHGHWLHIKNSTKLAQLDLSSATNRNKIFFFENILCLKDSNPIAEPPKKCRRGKRHGKGWLFRFIDDPERTKGKDWFKLSATLDSPTRRSLAKKEGIEMRELSIDVPLSEIETFESQGLLMRLDRDHPLREFDYIHKVPYFECGRRNSKTIKKQEVQKATAAIATNAGFDFFGWLGAKISASAETSVQSTEEETITIQQSTLKESLLYIFGMMYDNQDPDNRIEIPFLVEKRFQCLTDPSRGGRPGDKINEVTFIFKYPVDGDVPYTFRNPEEFVVSQENIYTFHKERPIFFSVNNGTLQRKIIQKIMDRHTDIDHTIAHFFFTHLNNGCIGRQMSDCEKLVEQATDDQPTIETSSTIEKN